MSDTGALPQNYRANSPAALRPKKQDKRATRPQLLTRAQLDGRTNAAKAFDAIAGAIAQDLGGEDRLSTVQKHLIEAFAGVAVQVADMNARKALGEPVDLLRQTQAISSMVRVASRLGLHRVAKPVESLAAILARRYQPEPEPEPESASSAGSG
jgi:hypothetical protein